MEEGEQSEPFSIKVPKICIPLIEEGEQSEHSSTKVDKVK